MGASPPVISATSFSSRQWHLRHHFEVQRIPQQRRLRHAFIRLTTASGSLVAADYFEMDNGVTESEGDVDLGSAGAILLSGIQDASGTAWKLAAGAGKRRQSLHRQSQLHGKVQFRQQQDLSGTPRSLARRHLILTRVLRQQAVFWPGRPAHPRFSI